VNLLGDLVESTEFICHKPECQVYVGTGGPGSLDYGMLSLHTFGLLSTRQSLSRVAAPGDGADSRVW